MGKLNFDTSHSIANVSNEYEKEYLDMFISAMKRLLFPHFLSVGFSVHLLIY